MSKLTITQSTSSQERINNSAFEKLYNLDVAGQTQINLAGSILIYPGAYQEQVTYMDAKYASLTIQVYNNSYFIKFRDNNFKNYILSTYFSNNVTDVTSYDLSTITGHVSLNGVLDTNNVSYADELVYTSITGINIQNNNNLIYFQLPSTLQGIRWQGFAGLYNCEKKIWFLNNVSYKYDGNNFIMFGSNAGQNTTERLHLAQRNVYLKNFPYWGNMSIFSYQSYPIFMVYSTTVGLNQPTSGQSDDPSIHGFYYNGYNKITHFVINQTTLPYTNTNAVSQNKNIFNNMDNIYVPSSMLQSWYDAIDNGTYLGDGIASTIKAKFKTIEDNCTIKSLVANGITNIYAIPQSREDEFCGLDSNNKLILIQEYM